MTKNRYCFVLLLMWQLFLSACGVKGKPLPPLQEPFISSGNRQEDLRKREKNQKKQQLLPNEKNANGR